MKMKGAVMTLEDATEKTHEELEQRGLVRRAIDEIKPEYVAAYELFRGVPGAIKRGLNKKYAFSWKGFKDLYNDSKNLINYTIALSAGTIYGSYAGFMHFCGRPVEQLGDEYFWQGIGESVQIGLSRAAMSFLIGGPLVKMIEQISTTRSERTITNELYSITSSYAITTGLWMSLLYGVLKAQGSEGIPETLGGEALSMMVDIPVIVYFLRNRINN